MSDDARVALRRLTRGVIDRPGVVGTAQTLDGDRPALAIYVSDEEYVSGLPSECDGFPVVVQVSGKARRY